MAAKKKGALARYKAARSNPSLAKDLGEQVLPALGAYVATRLLGRIAYVLVGRRFPKLGRHAHVLSQGAAFAGLWLAGHKIPQVEKYHDSVVTGAGVAFGQTLIQQYAPDRFKWLACDVKNDDVSGKGASSASVVDEDGDELDLEAAESSSEEDREESYDNLALPGSSLSSGSESGWASDAEIDSLLAGY